MIGLVDCNNFYASCERVFNPGLNRKPVVILSNNDGCVIARSNEAKQIGIKMGAPAFEIKDLVSKHQVAVFSSNYTLYGDMSNRVMTILSSFTPNIEIYSIDESFLDLSGFADLATYGRDIVTHTTRCTGISVSMGIAPTKTLAKVANKFAKKHKGYKGVCVLDNEQKRLKALELTEIGDVWGIGRRHGKRLQSFGVNTALDFTRLPASWVRKQMTVVGERTWRELHGESCIDLDLLPAPNKSICTSRSFGQLVTSYQELKEAIFYYTSICGEKLRSQRSCACSIMVFIHTNNFRTQDAQYFNQITVELPVPSNSTIELAHYAEQGLKTIFREGYKYKKAGIIITGIVPETGVQLSLFDNVDRSKHTDLMQVVDRLNKGFNKNVLHLAAQGSNTNTWKLKREKLSPNYTTKLSEVIEVKC